MIYVIYHAERFIQNGEFPYNEKEIRTMNEFITNIAENVTFVLEFLALVAALVAVAVIAEKLLNKRNGNDSKILTTRKVAMIGMFSACCRYLYDFGTAYAFCSVLLQDRPK